MTAQAPFVGWSDPRSLGVETAFPISKLSCGINAHRQITFASTTGPAYSRAQSAQQEMKGNMKSLKKTALVLALGLAAGGCSMLDTKPVAREDLTNAQGHVVGYKEMVRDSRTGEEMAQIALYVPRIGDRGEIIGYEERVRGGSVLHDLNGKRIGGRWDDLRGRGTNPQSKGLLIVVRGKRSDDVAVAKAPSIEDLIQLARLSN